MILPTRPLRRVLHLAVLVMLVLAAAAPAVQAQVPTQRQLRTFIPPDQLVSFLPSTPFDQFIELINPIMIKETGKQVVDPFSLRAPIGVPLSRTHYFDAFELVLNSHQLTFRETDRFFILTEAATQPDIVQNAEQARASTTPGAAAAATLPSLTTREIQINAVLFEVNHSKARDSGIDWNVLFGQNSSGGQAGGGQGGGGTGGGQAGGADEVSFELNTQRLFAGLEDIISAPEAISFSTLTQLFRFLESRGVGETVANPTVTVQSGQKGRIQIGSDIPVQTRDFSGNTITQFFSTGIIIDVLPTVLAEALEDTAGSPEIDFIHMDVRIEKSNSRPSLSGPIIDRNQVATQVILLDGEQTSIGGLFSTDETFSRRGVPILKDLPGWFFGIRYLFGYTQRSNTQKELLIVLQARMVDSLPQRAQRPFDRDLIEKHRREVQENLRRVGPELEGTVKQVPTTRKPR